MGIILPVDIKMKTERSRSPLMILSLPSDLSAGARYTFDFEDKPYSKYRPFNYLYVANRGSTNINVLINGTIQKTISAGTIESFDSDVLPAIWSVTIENPSTTDTVSKDDIEILIQKQNTIKNIIEKVVG